MSTPVAIIVARHRVTGRCVFLAEDGPRFVDHPLDASSWATEDHARTILGAYFAPGEVLIQTHAVGVATELLTLHDELVTLRDRADLLASRAARLSLLVLEQDSRADGGAR